MKKPLVVYACVGIFLLFALFTSLSPAASAEDSPGRKAVSKELEKSIGMPILDGNLWAKMTPDSKVAFVWGMWHVITIEYYLMGRYPDLRRENFSEKVTEGTYKKPMTMNEIVALIDKYYEENPGDRGKPVVAVIWDSMIKPNIKAGIDGLPLKPKE